MQYELEDGIAGVMARVRAAAKFAAMGGEVDACESGFALVEASIRALLSRRDHPSTPPLSGGLQLLPCAVMMNDASPQNGWLFVPHVDGKWVSLCKLDGFSGKIIEYWMGETASRDANPA